MPIVPGGEEERQQSGPPPPRHPPSARAGAPIQQQETAQRHENSTITKTLLKILRTQNTSEQARPFDRAQGASYAAQEMHGTLEIKNASSVASHAVNGTFLRRRRTRQLFRSISPTSVEKPELGKVKAVHTETEPQVESDIR